MLILLASTNQAVLDRWQGLLATRDRVERAFSAGDMERMVRGQSFDIILLHRPLVDDRTCAELHRLSPVTKLFLLSDQPHQEEGLYFLKQGIVGYANTYISPDRMAEAVHAINMGGVWLGQLVIQHLIREAYGAVAQRTPATPPATGGRFAAMTRMERKVAECVAKGCTNLEIAAQLDISERTVKAHLTAIYEKLHVANRLSLALLINQGEG